MLIVEVLIYVHLIWFGLYLIGRGLRREPGGMVGLATLVLAYAIGQETVNRVMDGASSLDRRIWAASVIASVLLAWAALLVAVSRKPEFNHRTAWGSSPPMSAGWPAAT